MSPINVTTSKQQITASVSEDKISANVSAGIGATGPTGAQGPSGVITVTAPITNAGTTTAANVGLAVGTGLAISGGSLVLGTHTHDDRYYTESEVDTLLAGKQPAGTYATLVGGTVPAGQLPSYVDDVLEYANLASLPNTGETGKIYVALNTGKIYRWSGSAYFEISPSPGSTDSVSEGSTNLYFTNARARNAFGTGTTGQVITWSGGQWTAATPSTYTLPTASDSVLGGVKVGDGVTITDGAISVSTDYAAATHAASHLPNGDDELFDQSLNTTDAPSFFGLTISGDSAFAEDPVMIVTSIGNQAPIGFVFEGTLTANVKGDASGFLALGALSAVVFEVGGFGGTYETARLNPDKSFVLAPAAEAPAGAAGALYVSSDGRLNLFDAGDDSWNAVVIDTDARLSDARTPTAHSHSWSDIASGVPTSLSGYGITDAVASNDSRLTDARNPTSHSHGNVTNAGAIGATSGLPVITTTDGVLTVGAFGTSAGQFAAGDHTHSQLHDRSHAITSTSDHTAGNWKTFYSNGSGQVVEIALGSSGKVLTSNGTAAAPTFETPAAAGVAAIGSSAADVFSVSGTDLVADDAGSADAIVFWDDSAAKLTYLTVGTGLSISSTTISAAVTPTVASPSQITSDQNDYAGATGDINRINSNAARNITGIAAGTDGQAVLLVNVGSYTITLKHQSTSSTAANRIIVPWANDYAIPADGSATLVYDNTTARWRVL